MKNIKFYNASKYKNGYEKVEENIFKIKGHFGECYVTSLSFDQEPELNEGEDSSNISNYPLEDVLDTYYVAIEDFYEELNDGSSNTCFLEFSGADVEEIRALLGIIGKHVYNKEYEVDGKQYVKLVIE